MARGVKKWAESVSGRDECKDCALMLTVDGCIDACDSSGLFYRLPNTKDTMVGSCSLSDLVEPK